MPQKIIFTLTFMLLALTVVCTSSHAEPGVSAQSALVLEKESGRVLYQKNSDSRLPMASTTKIMTAIVAIEQGDTSAEVEITDTAAGIEGSSMYLEAGEKMTLEELLYGLMLSSGNDAAVAIAEHFGGNDAFVELMNQKAAEIGAKNTHFSNPNGLPDDTHYSTAYDMALLAAYGLKNPKFAEIVATKSYQISGEGKAYPRTLTNHNKLLRMCEGCIGVKTGFTKAAGRCLVSACKRDGMTLVCVTLNAPDDWNDHSNLYDSMFSQYKLTEVLSGSRILGAAEVLDSEITVLPFTAKEGFSYPLKNGEECSLSVEVSSPIEAPVEDGRECGKVSVWLGDKKLTEIPAAVCGSANKRPAADVIKQGLKESLETIYKSWLMLLRG